MYFTARNYELRYATSRTLLRVNFNVAEKVTQEMIREGFDLNSPKLSGEKETIIINSPTVEGSQVSTFLHDEYKFYTNIIVTHICNQMCNKQITSAVLANNY